jgi:hypothetical protein
VAYLVLFLSSIALWIFTNRRVPEALPSQVVAAVGMGSSLGLSDCIISGLLHLYSFRPGLMADPTRDNVAGAILGDFLFVPITYGALMALFPRQRVAASAGLVLVMAVVELVFRRYGLFVHHYWSVWVTVILFAARFGLAVWWLGRLERVGYTPGFRLLLSTVSTTYIWWLWVTPVSGLFRVWEMRLHLLARPADDRLLSGFLLHGVVFAAAGVWFLLRRWGEQGWHWWAFAAGWAAYLYILQGLGVYRYQAGWSPVYDAAVLTAVLWGCGRLDAWAGEAFGYNSRPRARA